MAVPDRTDLTDCQDELYRMVRDANTRERRINDLEQHIAVMASTLHHFCKTRTGVWTFCENDPCRESRELLGIERHVFPKVYEGNEGQPIADNGFMDDAGLWNCHRCGNTMQPSVFECRHCQTSRAESYQAYCLKLLVDEREFARANGEEVDPQ